MSINGSIAIGKPTSATSAIDAANAAPPTLDEIIIA
jgi:hypothetical protein